MSGPDTSRHLADLAEILADPALGRVLDVLREKWVQYGRAAGRVTVKTDAEAFALGGLIGERLHTGRTLTAGKVEEALLHRSRFRCTLQTALEIHTERPLVSNAARAEARAASWRETEAHLLAIIDEAGLDPADRDELREWVLRERSDLKRRRSVMGDAFLPAFADAVRALAFRRPDNGVALAVLANDAMGDPHGLDAGTPTAALFDRALAVLYPSGAGGANGNAEARDELLAAASIARDRTSPKVDTFGLLGGSPDLAFFERFPLQTLTLRIVETYRELGFQARQGIVYVVENASVFDSLVERLSPLSPAMWRSLICTNGWFNLADRMLLGELHARGVRIRYSGDFDEKGLAMASDVLGRLQRAEVWRMAPDDYRRALRPGARGIRRRDLPAVVSALEPLRSAMAQERRVAFQEALLPTLLGDLEQDS